MCIYLLWTVASVPSKNEETEPTAEDIAAAEKQKEIYEQEMAAVNQEKQALMDMYRAMKPLPIQPQLIRRFKMGPAGEGLAKPLRRMNCWMRSANTK